MFESLPKACCAFMAFFKSLVGRLISLCTGLLYARPIRRSRSKSILVVLNGPTCVQDISCLGKMVGNYDSVLCVNLCRYFSIRRA